MTSAELREKIRLLVPTVVGNKKQAEAAAVEYDELTKFPELKAVIVDLLTHEFDSFLSSIDWVAPKPSTSRTSWIAQVEGKRYYLLNLPEEERATEAIARILRYGVKADTDAVEGGGEDVDVEVDDNIDIDV